MSGETKPKPEVKYPTITITRAELRMLAKRFRAHSLEFFAAIKMMSARRGLIYNRFVEDVRGRSVEAGPRIRTWFDDSGNFNQCNHQF
jgi:hypothetical protein